MIQLNDTDNYDGHLDNSAYEIARAFLLMQIREKVNSDDLGNPHTREPLTADAFLGGYTQNTWATPVTSLNDIYLRLITSAQNSRHMPTSIRRVLESTKNFDGIPEDVINSLSNRSMDAYLDLLRITLMDFDPRAISQRYPYDGHRNSESLKRASKQLYADICTALQPSITPTLKPNSPWTMFPKSIVSGARYLSSFNSLDDFRATVERFNGSDHQRLELLDNISAQVFYMRRALAADFLKEIGYPRFPKPDIHLKDICRILMLTERPDNDEDVFNAIWRIADNTGVEPYAIDKIFWLIGSGKFYFHDVRIGNNKQEFYEYAKSCGYPVPQSYDARTKRRKRLVRSL